MNTSFASRQLSSLVENIEFRNQTGCVSIEQHDGRFRKYGLLQYLKGELVAAEYCNDQGSQALQTISQLGTPKVSFAKGTVMLSKQF